MAQIGYDHKDTGETFYIKYPFKRYHQLISKITQQEGINKPLILKFDHTKSIYSLKYALKFQNLFYYRVNEERSNNVLQLFNFNLKLLQKNKMIKLVNFDVLPVVSLSMQNESSVLPFTVGLKFGKYQASRVQHFDSTAEVASYDFSKVLKSMLPYYRSGVRLSHHNQFDVNFMEKNFEILGKYMCSLNRIHGYEDTLKLSTNIKIYFDIFEEINRIFRLRVSDEIHVKKAFIHNLATKKGKGKFESESPVCKEYRDHHILSGYECHSKLLEMNILNTENVIENGSDFYVQNVSTIRVKDIPYLKDHEVLSRLNPYVSLETIFLPAYRFNIKGSKSDKSEFDLKNSFRFIYTCGLSIALSDYLHIDFALYSGASKNTKIKKEYLNRFRINLTI